MHPIDLEPMTLPSTLLKQGKELLFEVKLTSMCHVKATKIISFFLINRPKVQLSFRKLLSVMAAQLN